MLSSSPAGEKYSGITIVDQLGTINEIIMGYFQLILTNPYPITNAGCILSEFRRKESTWIPGYEISKDTLVLPKDKLDNSLSIYHKESKENTTVQL